jgi:hypothetical protein
MAAKQTKIVELATFTAGETEMITGVTTATQRDWRRRELASHPTRGGWTRFTTEDLVHLIVLDRLISTVRPEAGDELARQSLHAPIAILAKDAYPGVPVRLAGRKQPLEQPEALARYAVRVQFMDYSLLFLATNDLNSLPDQVRNSLHPGHPAYERSPIAYYIIVDLFGVANQMRARQTKPYFIEAQAKREK